MLSYFPAIQPYMTHRFKVESPHELYVEECGNPAGVPVLFVHGGPGSGCSEDSRRFFDPNRYRIILFDQRGTGRSTPHGEILHNNTQALIQDIEVIRNTLGVERWLLFGGSWGSTLGLLYAQAHPERVLAMILCSIYLARDKDTRWFCGGGGAQRVFPDHWQELLKILPPDQRRNPMVAYHQLLHGENEVLRMKAAEAWTTWESRCARLVPDADYIARRTHPHAALAYSRIESHYLHQRYFIAPNQILRHMREIKHIPSILVHGRQDMICLFEGAWKLHQAWSKSQLFIIPAAGHSSSEPAMLNALIQATEQMADRFVGID